MTLEKYHPLNYLETSAVLEVTEYHSLDHLGALRFTLTTVIETVGYALLNDNGLQ